jgi:hypothetical protein
MLHGCGIAIFLLLALAPAAPAAQPAATINPMPPGTAAAKAEALLKAELSWQKSLATRPTPGNGCFHAQYPNARWQPV